MGMSRIIKPSEFSFIQAKMREEEIKMKGPFGSISCYAEPNEYNKPSKFFRISRSSILKKSAKPFLNATTLRVSASTETEQAALDYLVYRIGRYDFTDRIIVTKEDIKSAISSDSIDEDMDILFDGENISIPNAKSALTKLLNSIESYEKASGMSEKYNGKIEIDMLSDVTISKAPRRVEINHRDEFNLGLI